MTRVNKGYFYPIAVIHLKTYLVKGETSKTFNLSM